MANIPSQQIELESTSTHGKVNYMPALVSLGVLYFMMGFITCLNDTLVPFFKKGFDLNYAQSSLVQFYFFLTYGLMSIPAGRIVSKVGYKNGMVLGFGIAAIGACLFYPASLLHEYYVFLAALFIVAIGIVLLQVAANPYITVLGPKETASSRLTLIQGIGSIGTTVAPLFGASFILSRFDVSTASSEAVVGPYIGIGITLLVIAVILSRLKLPEIKTAKSSDVGSSSGSILSHRNLKFGIIALFCYVGAEVTIGTFLTNYIADLLHIEEEQANNFVAIYWGSMFVGRILGSYILRYIQASKVLAVVVICAMLLIVISLLTSGFLAAWTMVAVGFCNSIMFAIIFSLSVVGLEENTTKASGFLSSAIAGGAIVSYLQGQLIDNFNWTISFLVPLICYLFILFFAISGYKVKKNAF